MFNRLSIILLSFMMLSSLAVYFFVEGSKNIVRAEMYQTASADIGNIESAKGVREFAYLEERQQDISFLEEEMKRQEEEKRRIEEERKAEAERIAKEEAERQAKLEAEKQAKLEAERKAKEEAESKAKEVLVKKQAQQKKSQASSNQALSAPSSDLDALAKIIHAEAKGESYQGKLAVGAVIVNRVQSGKFPNSIKGVIMAPGQFQPVSNGAYQSANPTSADYQAAQEALAGADPTGGATFFYAPNIATTKWHETLTHTVTIGNHKFFKN